MSSTPQSWLAHMPDFPGLLGAYVVGSGQPPEVRSWSDEFPVEAIVSLHQQVQDVLEVLEAGQNPARKLRWIFEQTVVYFERRRDGAAMCLITTHEPWVGEGDTLGQLIGDFSSAG